MMKQLTADTVRLLSSSQVITSVVNVVKELLENSLDAGAASIEVKLENYGLDRIEVRDNGSGIKAADTPVMAVKHYTSKICSHDDLEHLETYGFRGEALGSICSVAEVAITTKTVDDDVSTNYTLDLTGRVVSQKPSHLGQGTTVSVLKLFKNLPVRRQYYASTKQCKEEMKKVQDLLMAYAIIKPELRLTLHHNKVVVWQKAKVSDHRTALLATLGASAVANLLPVHHRQEQPEIVIDGFIPKPGADYSSTSSSSPDKTFIYVNDRPVYQKDILKLVRQQYVAQYPADVPRHRFPTLMLNVTVPASTVDVNLTPDKTMILLQNKEAVLATVESLLISLYSPGPVTEAPPVRGVDDGVSAMPSSPLHAGSSRLADDRGSTDRENSLMDHRPVSDCNDTEALGGDTSLNHQTANSSSSSSLAEDWIINQIPGDFDLNFSLLEDDMALTCTGTTGPATSPDRLTTNPDKVTDQGKDVGYLSAESWSRGTALTDPSTGEPLQPVRVHLPTVSSHSGVAEGKGQHSPGKKLSHAITEKRATLTAYDLISNRVMRTPLSPAALFERETRTEILKEKPKASLQEITTSLQERWKNLGEEDRKKYEEKAKKHLEHYDLQSKLAYDGGKRESKRQPSLGSKLSWSQGQKRKAPLSNQQSLDQLLSPQAQKKRCPGTKPLQTLPFSVDTLRQQLHCLSSQRGPTPRGLWLVKHLASQNTWVVLRGRKLMLLNPFRVEEALLFKRLLENNILPAVSLQNPILLTDGNLGGAECTEALFAMERGRPELDGAAFYSDFRLVANGFKIRLNPGSLSAERQLEVTAMADCVPFLCIDDLREILTAVLYRNAKTVQECRPLKVTNYLQGEAVRLARQLPVTFTKGDVEDTLSRMQQQLQETCRTCPHGRPFFHHLSDVPDTEPKAKIMSNPL